MIPYRTPSIALADLLAEAQRLLDLKAAFGRLPDSVVKTTALEEIEEWFCAKGESSDLVQTPECLDHRSSQHDVVKSHQEAGFLSGNTDTTARADELCPDDDDIPF